MFKPARLDEYIEWLKGFLATGGTLTNAYDYPWQRVDFLLATCNFRLGGECGSDARPIIVAEGAQHLGGDLGHNTLYFMDEFRLAGMKRVPVFGDPAFEALPGVEAFRRAEELKKSEWLRERAKRDAKDAGNRATSDLSGYLGSRTR